MKLKEIFEDRYEKQRINKINVEMVVSKWDYLWVLIERVGTDFHIIKKYTNTDSLKEDMSSAISNKQAELLKWELELERTGQGGESSKIWRRVGDLKQLKGSAMLPRVKTTSLEMKQRIYRCGYLFTTLKDKRVSVIAEELGLSNSITHLALNKWIDLSAKAKGLDFIRSAKNMDIYVDVSIEDDQNQYKLGKSCV